MEEAKTWVYAPMEPAKTESVRCGGAVRWRSKAGKLEQLWIITEYIGSSPSGQREEWRDVPWVD
jgi:hypothetical protein